MAGKLQNLFRGLAWLVTRSGSTYWEKGYDLPGLGRKEQLRSEYKNSVWVNRAIQLAANPASALPVDLLAGDEPLPDDSPARAVLARMNQASENGLAFELAAWILLEGEHFLVLDDEWLRPFPETSNAERLSLPRIVRPDHMRHIVKGGELVGWEAVLPGGRREVLLPEQVIQRKAWNPYDHWRGLSQAKVAMDAAETDYLAGKFSRNLMANNGDQGVYVIAKGGMPDDAQRDQIIRQLREKRRFQQQGEFRPVFLWGDMQIEDAKIKTVDSAFLSGREASKEEIFVAFGVPPSMASKMESYSVGSASDWFRLINDTCQPLAAKVDHSLLELLAKVDRRLTAVRRDWDEHPVMQEVRSERIEGATKLWDRGMPWEKVNEFFRLGMPEFEGWGTGYLPFSVAPASMAQDPTKDPAYGEKKPTAAPATKAFDDLTNALNARPERQKGEDEEDEGDEFQDGRPQREIAQWRTQMQARKPVEKAFQSRFTRELMQARKEVLANIDRLMNADGKAVQKTTAADLNFNLSSFSGALLVGMRQVSKRALDESGKQLAAELMLDDPFVFADPEVLGYFRTRENLIAGAADDIHAEIQRELALGIDQGESTEALAKRLRAKFSAIGRERGQRIAITETASAFGHGRQVSMREAGITRKKWLTSGNRNTREEHAAANGQIVGIDEPFAVGGEALMHPGDPNGSPWNVINCRCVAVPVAGEEEEA